MQISILPLTVVDKYLKKFELYKRQRSNNTKIEVELKAKAS